MGYGIKSETNAFLMLVHMYIATPYVCDKIFVAKSELFPVEIMLCTPPRTPRLRGLKSQVWKPTFLA